jgi:hypothetical protein
MQNFNLRESGQRDTHNSCVFNGIAVRLGSFVIVLVRLESKIDEVCELDSVCMPEVVMTIDEGPTDASQRNTVMELVERCESDALRVTRTTFATPRLDAGRVPQYQSVDALVSFIAGKNPPPDRLVRGLRQQLGRLRATVHCDKNKLSLTELRARASKVSDAAICLQSFPKNGQLDKGKMAEAKEGAETLRHELSSLDLLSYIFKDEPFEIDLLLADALDAIYERARWASEAKNGRPKTLAAFELPFWEMLGPKLEDLAIRADEAVKRPKVKKRMRTDDEYVEVLFRDPTFSLDASLSALRSHDGTKPETGGQGASKKKRNPDEQKYSPELHCAVVVGVAYSIVSSSKKSLAFPGDADQACETLLRSAGGTEHKLNRASAHRYWRDIMRDARKPASFELVRQVKSSFG